MSWPFTGRSTELAALVRSLRKPGAGALVTGPAGIGLSSLLRRLEAQAGSEFHFVRAITEPGSEETPLAALAHLCPGASADSGEHGVPRDLPSEPARLIPALMRILDPPGQPGRTVILADDAEYLDRMSLQLITRIAESGRGAVVAAYHGSSYATERLEQLWQSGQLELIELPGLTPADIVTLFGEWNGGRLSDPSARYFADLTLGRPGWLRPLMMDAHAAGAITEIEGYWVCGERRFPVPLLARAARAGLATEREAVRQVVRDVSLVDQLPLSVLDKLDGRDAISAAETQGWVRITASPGTGAEPRVRLVVPAVGMGEQQVLGTAESRARRSVIVRAWREAGEMGAEEELRYVLAVRGSDDVPTAAQLGRAAAVAAREFRASTAEDLAGQALASRTQFHELSMAANIQLLRSRSVEDLGLLDSLHRNATSDQARAEAAYQRQTAHYWLTGDAVTNARQLEDLEATLTDPSARADLKATLASFAADQWHFDEARSLLTDALKEEQRGDLTLIGASYTACLLLRGSGQPFPGAPSLAEADAVYDRRPEWLSSLAAWIAVVAGLPFFTGRNPEIDEIIARRTSPMLRSGDQYGIALGTTLLAQMAIGRGEIRQANRHLAEAVVLLENVGNPLWIDRNLARLAMTEALLGDLDLSRQMLARTELSEQRPDPACIIRQYRAFAKIALTAGSGAMSESYALTHAEADRAAREGAHGFEVLLRHEGVRLGDPTHAERLAELAELCDVVRARLASAHAAALAARDPAALTASGKALAASGFALYSMDAYAQAAAVMQDDRDKSAYWQAVHRADEQRERCGIKTPAWLAIERPLPLTAREEEVARMAAAGASNQEIAERLVISARTAEGHLQRAYAKLGIHDRAALAAALDRNE